MNSKDVKKILIEKASNEPEKYFPVSKLEEYGFKRQKCSKCGRWFWSVEDRDVCGDTSCVGKYDFIGKTPAKKAFEFDEVYKNFSKFMSKRGYMPVERFPIVVRWRDDLDFNIASIIGFQPYVTKGLVQPPAELLTIPQNCLRFPDIDNVGFTGRHGTNFVMIGQCAFKKPDEYNQEKYFSDLLDWFLTEMKIPINEIQIHEDAWVGGGDCGPSMEFFSRGLELANQVYMWFQMDENEKGDLELKPLKLKVLDMGMGLERCSWFSKGSKNQYEATMPRICDYLFEKTKLKPDWNLYEKFLPYAGNLNLDEIEDLDKEWDIISKKLNVPLQKLKNEVEKIAGIYSIADHTRTLLYALNDGALPSNVKGGYNLRLVLRRALEFIDKFNWNLNLIELIKLQIEETRKLFPDIGNNLDDIKKIIQNEIEKYKNHKEKIENKLKNLLNIDESKIDLDFFIKLYVSDGISPEEIKNYFNLHGKYIKIPNNFYNILVEHFENNKQKTDKKDKKKFEKYIENLPDTKLIFYEDSNLLEFEDTKILKEFDIDDEHFIILDKTIFYPTMGGQASDTGFIDSKKVLDVFKIDNIIIHKVKN